MVAVVQRYIHWSMLYLFESSSYQLTQYIFQLSTLDKSAAIAATIHPLFALHQLQSMRLQFQPACQKIKPVRSFYLFYITKVYAYVTNNFTAAINNTVASIYFNIPCFNLTEPI